MIALGIVAAVVPVAVWRRNPRLAREKAAYPSEFTCCHVFGLFTLAGWILRLNSLFFFSSRRRHTRFDCDWSSDVCSSDRSEEHTSELQSQSNLVCRLLLEFRRVLFRSIGRAHV